MTTLNEVEAPWAFIFHRAYSKGFKEIKKELMSNGAVPDSLRQLRMKAGVNPDQLLA